MLANEIKLLRPMRLQQARAAGDIPKSAELAASLSMLGAIGAAYLTFSNVSQWLQRSTDRFMVTSTISRVFYGRVGEPNADLVV